MLAKRIFASLLVIGVLMGAAVTIASLTTQPSAADPPKPTGNDN